MGRTLPWTNASPELGGRHARRWRWAMHSNCWHTVTPGHREGNPGGLGDRNAIGVTQQMAHGSCRSNGQRRTSRVTSSCCAEISSPSQLRLR